MSKQCPWYQGVCALDEDFICYTDKDSCDIYKDWQKKVEVKIFSEEDRRRLKNINRNDHTTIGGWTLGEET